MVVAGQPLKGITTRCEVGKECLPPNAGVDPALVKPLQPVSEFHSFRNGEAQPIIVKPHLLGEWGYTRIRIRRILSAICGNSPNGYGRWNVVVHDVCRIKASHTADRVDPQHPVAALNYRLKIGSATVWSLRQVAHFIKNFKFKRMTWILKRLLNLILEDMDDAGGGSQPEAVTQRCDQPVDNPEVGSV